MPYIPQADRAVLDQQTLAQMPCNTEGILAYCISRLLKSFLGRRSESYANYAAAIGVLDTVKTELYRAMIAAYEDSKMEENGDVWPVFRLPSTGKRQFGGAL